MAPAQRASTRRLGTIVLASDLSAGARAAGRRVLLLQDAGDATIDLLHVLQAPLEGTARCWALAGAPCDVQVARPARFTLELP